MKTKELNRDRWEDFCAKLARERAGSLVTLSSVSDAGRETPVFRSEPLEDIGFTERKGECSDVLTIRLRSGEHQITEPIYIRLRDGGNERYNRIEILAESGGTVLELNPGVTASFAE